MRTFITSKKIARVRSLLVVFILLLLNEENMSFFDVEDLLLTIVYPTKFICSPQEKCHNGVIDVLPRAGFLGRKTRSTCYFRVRCTRGVDAAVPVAFQILRGILKSTAHGLFCKTSYSQKHSPAIGPVRSPSSADARYSPVRETCD